MSSADAAGGFESLLNYLKRSRSFDFTGYKRASLTRRINKRMQEVGIEAYGDYQDFLEVHPEEFAVLFNTILINVTGFFRDSPVWEAVASDILPRILGPKPAAGPIRAWSAGCASGEEAYTLALVLAEALGPEQFRERVKIYATDVDDEGLLKARHATYSAREVTGVPPPLLERYFDRVGQQFVFNKELRRSIIFGRHDLIQDAPISRVDLLVCRNTLMYFNAESQALILSRFHFALNNPGFLVLGKAEMLSAMGGAFVPTDLRRRIFAKVAGTTLRNHLLPASPADALVNGGGAGDPVARRGRLLEAAFDDSLIAQVVVDRQGVLVLLNERACTLFGLNARDIGRRLQDVELSYRPVELRSHIEQAYRELRPIIVNGVEWSAGGEPAYFDVQVRALLDTEGTLLGASITFADITRFRRLQEELRSSNQELEATLEELRSTNEELETTNEELHSTVEELETTNEELQSTNEELETMNEELQATVEELATTNEELRRRGDELNEVNAYLAAVLTSWRSGVVVLNQRLEIQVWNGHAEELWGLRADEVAGRHFLNLDIGLPVEQLHGPLRACLVGEADAIEVILPSVNRRGRPLRCRVTCMAFHGQDGTPPGVILAMEPVNDVEDGE